MDYNLFLTSSLLTRNTILLLSLSAGRLSLMLNNPRALDTRRLKRHCSNSSLSLQPNPSIKASIPISTHVEALGTHIVSSYSDLKISLSMCSTTSVRINYMPGFIFIVLPQRRSFQHGRNAAEQFLLGCIC